MGSLEFKCPHCGETVKAFPDSFGEIVGCPYCENEFEIPDVKSQANVEQNIPESELWEQENELSDPETKGYSPETTSEPSGWVAAWLIFLSIIFIIFMIYPLILRIVWNANDRKIRVKRANAQYTQSSRQYDETQASGNLSHLQQDSPIGRTRKVRLGLYAPEDKGLIWEAWKGAKNWARSTGQGILWTLGDIGFDAAERAYETMRFADQFRGNSRPGDGFVNKMAYCIGSSLACAFTLFIIIFLIFVVKEKKSPITYYKDMKLLAKKEAEQRAAMFAGKTGPVSYKNRYPTSVIATNVSGNNLNNEIFLNFCLRDSKNTALKKTKDLVKQGKASLFDDKDLENNEKDDTSLSFVYKGSLCDKVSLHFFKNQLWMCKLSNVSTEMSLEDMLVEQYGEPDISVEGRTTYQVWVYGNREVLWLSDQHVGDEPYWATCLIRYTDIFIEEDRRNAAVAAAAAAEEKQQQELLDAL